MATSVLGVVLNLLFSQFKAANGKQAQQENASFASLNANSPCTEGQNG
jgi:hypothetical protein